MGSWFSGKNDGEKDTPKVEAAELQLKVSHDVTKVFNLVSQPENYRLLLAKIYPEVMSEIEDNMNDIIITPVSDDGSTRIFVAETEVTFPKADGLKQKAIFAALKKVLPTQVEFTCDRDKALNTRTLNGVGGEMRTSWKFAATPDGGTVVDVSAELEVPSVVRKVAGSYIDEARMEFEARKDYIVQQIEEYANDALSKLDGHDDGVPPTSPQQPTITPRP
jgi:hypothetical protein